MNRTSDSDSAAFGVEHTTHIAERPDDSEIFGRYAGLIRYLRSPDGCPWDRKQTLDSLRRFIIEEAFELVAAIDDAEDPQDDPPNPATVLDDAADELGDLFLVALLTSDAMEAAGGPSLRDVLNRSGQKLVRRHPHVFGDVVAETPEAVVDSWNSIKENVEGRPASPDGVSRSLPPLMRAVELQKKAARTGFDWAPDDLAPVIDKIREETAELEHALATGDAKQVESELGDLLFSVVNVARRAKTDPSLALAGTNDRFTRRFQFVQERCTRQGLRIDELTIEGLDEFWNEAKRNGL